MIKEYLILETENTFGTTYIFCDNDDCKSEHIFDALIDNYPDIEDACKDAKDYGWIIFKEDDEWYHYCSVECKEKDSK